jgi:vancomycin resistance protein YoaR
MRETALANPSTHRPLPLAAQFVVALGGGIFLFAVLLGLVFAGFEIQYAGKIFPGISVAGQDLSGFTPNQATELIAESLAYSLEGRIAFQDGEKLWLAAPLELGLFLDAESSAQAAYRYGRGGGLFQRLSNQYTAWTTGIDLPPYMVYDERSAQRYLENIAAEVNRPVIEAQLGLTGIDVQVRSGQIGRTVDLERSLARLGPQFASLTDGIIPLVIKETPPVILDVTEQAKIAQNILSAPLELLIADPNEGDPGPWTFDPQTLVTMLNIERVTTSEGDNYQVGLNTDDLQRFLESLAPKLEVTPVNARFIFNDDTDELDLLESAVIGRRLQIEDTIQAINARLGEGEHTIPLAFELEEPLAKDDSTTADMGITELVNAETSYFYGSSAGRIQNIEAAASRFHGLLVAPGETFSMANALGDISLDNGYAEALIIFGDRTIKGVGGGVCQVSTTLFRNVFFAGYPVVERYQHAYRVYYYELTAGNTHNANLAGLDATVYVPLVDFKFTNDTPYWLLMETYVNVPARSLTWKFYSTSDGREVDWQTTGLRNRVDPPEPLYQENPDLAKGEKRQVDWAVEGADVTITRTVSRDGQIYLEDAFHTHYVPWREVWEYGPGTEGIPTPEPEGEPVG